MESEYLDEPVLSRDPVFVEEGQLENMFLGQDEPE